MTEFLPEAPTPQPPTIGQPQQPGLGQPPFTSGRPQQAAYGQQHPSYERLQPGYGQPQQTGYGQPQQAGYGQSRTPYVQPQPPAMTYPSDGSAEGSSWFLAILAGIATGAVAAFVYASLSFVMGHRIPRAWHGGGRRDRLRGRQDVGARGSAQWRHLGSSRRARHARRRRCCSLSSRWQGRSARG